MNQESVRLVRGEKLGELLDRSVGGGMGCDVGVQNPARPDFDGDEYVQRSESCSDGREEIAGSHTFCVVAHECGPSEGEKGVEEGLRESVNLQLAESDCKSSRFPIRSLFTERSRQLAQNKATARWLLAPLASAGEGGACTHRYTRIS